MHWTDEETRTLVSLWPTSTAAQIATRLHRSNSAIAGKAKQLQDVGLLEVKRGRPTNPDPQDFEAKRRYCRKHHGSIAKLCTKLERDNQLAAELYRLAQAAKLIRLAQRRRSA